MIINNVRITDHNKDFMGSVTIEKGAILQVSKNLSTPGENAIDGMGKALMPSFIDMHCHLREPGFEYKEDMQTGMSAALKGGFTHLCAMANTWPVMDDAVLIQKNMEKSKELELCDLIQVSAVTKAFEDEASQVVDFEAIREFTNVFSNDGKNMADEVGIEIALKKSAELDFILSCHCEPETEMAVRYIDIARRTGGNLHICHISLQTTLEAIGKAKKEGIKISCEVTPHHLFHYEDSYLVNPPFATKADKDALITGIKKGLIDVCATDHAPHSQQDKENGAPGISNIENAFSMYNKVFKDENISISVLSEMLSFQPARLLGLNAGAIEPGMEANLVLVDLEKTGRIDTSRFLSKGKNTPFNGREVTGEILLTIKRGEIKYDNRQIV
ncbi:MAG: dihydroorotase [Eubacteriaceae bacterium]|nr:dihydroorotase [Eubacteriaceae bacterium]